METPAGSTSERKLRQQLAQAWENQAAAQREVARLTDEVYKLRHSRAAALEEVKRLHQENDQLRSQTALNQASSCWTQPTTITAAEHDAESARLCGRQTELVTAAAKALGEVEETLATEQFQQALTPSDREQLKVIARVREQLVMDKDPTYSYVAAALLDLIAISPVPSASDHPHTYLVKDTRGTSCQTGVNYCFSQNRTDFATTVAEWNTFVQGVPMDTGKEWVKVGELFLPVKDRLHQVRAQAGQSNEIARQRVLYAVAHVIRSAERALRDVIVVRIARDSKAKDRKDFDNNAMRVFGLEQERDVQLLSQLYLSYSKVMAGSSWSFDSKAQLAAFKKGPRLRQNTQHEPATIKNLESFILASAQNGDAAHSDQRVDQPQYVEVPPPCLTMLPSDSLFCEPFRFENIGNTNWNFVGNDLSFTDHSRCWHSSTIASSSRYDAQYSVTQNADFWPSGHSPFFFPPFASNE